VPNIAVLILRISSILVECLSRFVGRPILAAAAFEADLPGSDTIAIRYNPWRKPGDANSTS
jgi:hypothetical protein